MPKHRDNGMNVGTGARAAIYPRYSSNLSRSASLEDQERNCRNYADEKGWNVLPEFVCGDAAKTGRKLSNRPGLDLLLNAAAQKPRPFDILIIDEPSRLSRKVDHVIKVTERLARHGIVIVFVSRRMQSNDPNFKNNLMFHSMSDEMSSEQLADRVHRGHEGRALKGFSTGSRCFGYRSEQIADPMKPWAQSRVDMLGVKWVVIPGEAAIIIRIFEMFADGWSCWGIAMQLNQEKVPATRKTRVDDPDRYWNATLIKNILKREKYIGKIVWNKTHQDIDSETEQTLTVKNPPEVWIFQDAPHLRIVSDELWARVQARSKVVNEKMTPRRLGGLNRAKKRTYLFSGLLCCGECGSPITIGGSGGRKRMATYGCRSRRYNRGCTNNLWIREDRVTGQLLQAMTKNLLQPDVMGYFIASVTDEFDAYLKGKKGSFATPLEALKAEEATHKAAISRLIATIMNPLSANSDALPVMLAQQEAELKRVQNNLALLAAPKSLAAAKFDIDAIVRANVQNLQRIIMQDPLKAREVFQRYVKRLTLYPTANADGEQVYQVVGELDLFASGNDDKHRMMLDRSSTGMVQQYAQHVDFVFRFAGLIVDPMIDPWVNPLIAPFEDLLASAPELLHEPKRALDWVDYLKPHILKGSKLYEQVNADYMSWNLRNHAELFESNFGMISLTIARNTYFMFTRAQPEEEMVSVAIDALGG